MGEHTWPIVWCGEKLSGQDVSIRLVLNKINQEVSAGTLAELKVHSSHLRKCSRYFETCLSERWAKPSSEPALEFVLEVYKEISCYTDCFSRMYTPFLKDFKNVKYSLELLQVASQIEFHELMRSICRYISTTLWSVEDELRIRLYSSSPDFPRNHAKDLVARLELDMSKEDCHKQSCDAVEHCIRNALRHEGSYLFARGVFEELFQGIAQSASSTFEKDVVMIVSKEAKDMFVRFHEECDGKGIEQVHGFVPKLLAIDWVLNALLRAQVAEEVVECFLHLELFPRILLNAAGFSSHTEFVAVKFAKLFLLIYQEVVVGNLLLGIPDRVALLENWLVLFQKVLGFRKNYEQATEDLFLTLPFKQQMELIKLEGDKYNCYISTSSLAALVKSRWRVDEEVVKAEVEADLVVSDTVDS